MTSLH